MTALDLNLYAQVGPDHYFLVVPAVSEYFSLLFLAVKGGHVARRGPADVRVTSAGSLPRRCSLLSSRAITTRLANQRASLHSPSFRQLTVIVLHCGLAGQSGIAFPLFWHATRGSPTHPPHRSSSAPFPPNVASDSLDMLHLGPLSSGLDWVPS